MIVKTYDNNICNVAKNFFKSCIYIWVSPVILFFNHNRCSLYIYGVGSVCCVSADLCICRNVTEVLIPENGHQFNFNSLSVFDKIQCSILLNRKLET